MENKFPKRVAVGVSIFCCLFIIVHLVWPKLPIDNTILILIGIGLLPWLSLFVKKFKLPGGVEGETYQISQSTTKKPVPPANDSKPPESLDSELSAEAIKILTTLWRYQKQHFEKDRSNRWTFIVSPTAHLFPEYFRGTRELFDKGLISFAPDYHIMLTNEGLNFTENNEDVQQYKDLYRF